MAAATVWEALIRPPWRFLGSRWPWLALLYLLVSAVIGVVLLPLAALTLLLLPLWGMAIGALERRRTRMLGFGRQPSPHVLVVPDERHNWLGIRLTEAATWRETCALLVDLVWGWLALAAVFLQVLMGAVLVAMATVGARENTEILLFFETRITVGPSTWWLVLPVGALALVLFAYVNALLAGAQAALLRVLCAPRNSEMARNVERLTRSRLALVEAFEAERRRIERDLHDGVQQELVTLAARLGLLSLDLDELVERGVDASAARAALESAQDQAEHAMATLRSTVRGIHPAVLTDEGLEAALAELAGRTPVALELDIAGLGRLAPSAETAAYYLVSESVTNAAKHADASRVGIAARLDAGSLLVTVRDDGRGGADEDAGSGLRGLRERAEALGGSLTVSSPTGGPTVLTMVLPASGLSLTKEMEVRDAPAPR